MPRIYPGEGQTPATAATRCRLSATPHALERQLQRGIEDEEIRNIIRRGTRIRVRERTVQGEKYKWIASNQAITAVFFLRPCLMLLKTVMHT